MLSQFIVKNFVIGLLVFVVSAAFVDAEMAAFGTEFITQDPAAVALVVVVACVPWRVLADVVVEDSVVAATTIVDVFAVAADTGPTFGIPPDMRGRLFRQTETLEFSETLTFGKL